MPTLAKNRKAFHDFEIIDRFEAGIALVGTEVKSCRQGNVQLVDSYARVRDGEMWLTGVHISPYSAGNQFNHDPKRPRKLLLHRREIQRLQQAIEARGLTLVPLAFYTKNNRIKVELGLCRGKSHHDKRDTLRRKAHEEEARRAMRHG